MTSPAYPPIVGADEKITGTARYAGDIDVAGMLHAAPVLSPYARARIASIDPSAARAAPGVVAVLVASDLPLADRPATDRRSAVLATGCVMFPGQPVALVVAETESAARDAVSDVIVEYEPEDPVIDALAALQPEASLVWPDGIPGGAGADADVHAGGAGGGAAAAPVSGNVAKSVRYTRGDPSAGFAAADVIVQRTFRTAIVHQAYLEPHACVAAADPIDGRLTVWTGTQGQFMVRDTVARILGVGRDEVRIVPMAFGGGFGAKYGIVEPLVAAAARALGRPVRMVLTRSEDFATTTPAPACVFDVKVGARRDGSLTALEGRVVLDSGAFPSDLIGIACILLGGYYRFEHLDITGHEVVTNTPMVGAYRAPGAPQATFAIESLIDELATQLALDPIALRIANAVVTGDPMPDGKPWPSIGLVECLERAAAHPMWQQRTAVPAGTGIGVAAGGWPGGTAPAAAVCRADSDGLIHLHVGSVDVTGTSTALTLVAAAVIGVPVDQVRVVAGDTSVGPFSGPSGGSMITYTVGSAVAEAAREAKRQILDIAADMLEASAEDLEIADGVVRVKGDPGPGLPVAKVARATAAFGGRHAPIVAQGRSAITTQAPGFTVQLAEVAVDAEVGSVDLRRTVLIQDVGHPIHPPLVEGQMHGGAAQGYGWALLEQLGYDAEGQLRGGSFMDYLPPGAPEMPQVETIMVEVPAPHGPFGARGVGEPPIVAGPAAVANAVHAAVGARVTELPVTPARVWAALAGDRR